MFFPILFARIKESAYLYRKYFYYSPLNVKIMASRRELKKNVNYIAGELFPAAVQRVRHAVFLRQSGLHKGGGSTQQRSDPHPEHRACAAR